MLDFLIEDCQSQIIGAVVLACGHVTDLSVSVNGAPLCFYQNFKQRLTRQQAASLAACAHCGMCSESCHYFLATSDPSMTPAYKADRIRQVYKHNYDWLGKVAPWWVGAKPVRTDQELEDGKDYLTGSLPLRLETNEGIAGTLLDMELHQLGDDYIIRYPDLMRAVTKEQIQAAAQKYLDPEHYALVIVGPYEDE